MTSYMLIFTSLYVLYTYSCLAHLDINLKKLMLKFRFIDSYSSIKQYF